MGKESLLRSRGFNMKFKEITPNLLDRCISYISPRAGEKRMRAKYRAGIMERRFNGALKGGRLRDWNPRSTDANAEIISALPILRDRSRDLVRNNPHAKSALSELVNNIAGTGIKVRLEHDNEAHEKLIQSVWKEWAESKDCDFYGKHKLRGIQALACRAFLESGEVFIRKRIVRGAKIPLKLQVLESDHLADYLNDGTKVINGIEYDTEGRIIAYHFYKDHPGSHVVYSAKQETVRVKKDMVMHIFVEERPGQSRGIPIFTPVINKLNDIDEFEDAEIVRQKISSCFTAFVHDIEPGENLFDEDEMELGEKVTPGQIEFLPPGKNVTFGNPGTKEGYPEFMSKGLHSISSGVGVTYEAMTGDYSDTNYSSGKMGHNKMQRSVRVFQQLIMIDQFLDDLVSEFKRWLPFIDLSPEGITGRFTPPRVEMIDPIKDTKSLSMMSRNGFRAWSDIVSELGEDPDELRERIAVDRDRNKKLNLVLDSDPSTTQQNGNLHSLDETEPEKPEEG